jgi:hypothetical protein
MACLWRFCDGLRNLALLLGLTARPIDKLRINGDMSIGYNDASFTRISPRQIQNYKLHVNYKPQPGASLDGSINIRENRRVAHPCLMALPHKQ